MRVLLLFLSILLWCSHAHADDCVRMADRFTAAYASAVEDRAYVALIEQAAEMKQNGCQVPALEPSVRMWADAAECDMRRGDCIGWQPDPLTMVGARLNCQSVSYILRKDGVAPQEVVILKRWLAKNQCPLLGGMDFTQRRVALVVDTSGSMDGSSLDLYREVIVKEGGTIDSIILFEKSARSVDPKTPASGIRFSGQTENVINALLDAIRRRPAPEAVVLVTDEGGDDIHRLEELPSTVPILTFCTKRRDAACELTAMELAKITNGAYVLE